MATNSGGVLGVLRATLNSLWLCRVSVLSVAAGLLLFIYAPQAQAVFFDLHTWEVGLRHWSAFYAFVFLFWMLPTQLSARVMLQVGEDRLPEGHHASYAWLMTHLPWLLGLLCVASVAVGQYTALEQVPDERSRDDLEQAAYAQVITLAAVTAALSAVWVLAWIAIRPLLNRFAVRSGLLDNVVFRFIATAMFGERPSKRAGQPETAGGNPARFPPQQLQTAWAAILLAFVWLASLYFIYLSPLDIAPALSRAPMLPVLIGIWIPVLTFLVYFAHRLRLPILAAFILLTTFLSNAIPGLHAMRILAQAGQGAPLQSRQPTLEESLRWWRKANGCPPELRTECNARPIIVAAEGGASRAAFFTASLLAYMEDLSDPALRGGGAPGAPQFSQQLFAISAVSGSSLGAAVFAALREDARAEAWPRPRPEAPENALWFRTGRAVGVGGVKPEPLPTASMRKDVVQQILAGDFLTPAAAALNLDLLVPFHARTYNPGDRTYFLERSWERRFADPSGSSRAALKPGFERPFSSLAPEEGTWRPLLIFNGTSVTTGRRIVTSSLYPLFPSPDDPSGLPDDQRTVESVFRNAYDTYDLMCLPDVLPAGGACTCVQRGKGNEMQTVRLKGCDVRLSTAVSNSSRFPVISSHGDIGARPADRIVDGAYFDYSGIVSALELHVQITRLDDNLRPFVLFVTNDPGFNPRACQQDGPRQVDELDVLRRPAVPPSASGDWELFSLLRYPIDALINVRVARSEQTMAQAVLLNRYENVKAGFMTAPQKLADLREGLQAYMSFDIISVGARCNKEKQVRPIPMNWWLSMPTQAYLDQEICARHNRGSIAGVLSQLGAQPPPDDRPQHAARYQAEKRRVDEQCAERDGAPMRGRQTR